MSSATVSDRFAFGKDSVLIVQKSGLARKILHLRGFKFRAVQPVGSCYANCVTSTTDVIRKAKNTHTAERPAACDLIRGNKAVDLFPRIESQAAVCVFLP